MTARLFLLAALLLLPGARRIEPRPPATPASIAALPPAATRGFGARLPFTEYEAEAARSTGEIIGPDRTFTTIAAEASGRRAVRFTRRGQWIGFTLREAADAVTLRAAIPDTADGHGLDATLTVSAGGHPLGRIGLTSRYAWLYGRYPFTNRPADGAPHHVFDEARLRFGRLLPAGTEVRFEVAAGDDARWYAIDLADFERVPPPRARPSQSLSLLDFGADPTGARSSAMAFDRGIAAARRARVPLWIPPGSFRVDRHVEVDRVRILGAGPWHSIVRGDGVGFYGKPAPRGSARVELGHFAILGEVTDRVDEAQRNAIGGAMGDGSSIHDLLIQHHKVGLWFDGPMDGLRVGRLRVVDCTADGLNFRRGVSHAVVEDSFWRNTGDDALAAWSHRDADHHVAFRGNTVVMPTLANGIAIYGGHDIDVTGNLVTDTLTQGGGLHLGNRFDAVPASGRITFARNMTVRSGSVDPHWRFGVGALWFYALDHPLNASVFVSGNVMVDSTAEAIQFLGKRIDGVRIDRSVVERAATAAFQLQSPGSAVVRRTTLHATPLLIGSPCDPAFTLTIVGTRSGRRSVADCAGERTRGGSTR